MIRFITLSLFCVALTASISAFAQQQSIEACLAPVVDDLRAHNAQPVNATTRGFLLEGESAVHEENIGDEARCVGFLALGGKNVRDIDLALYTNTGTSLVENVATDAHPYVRFCGAAHLPLRVVVRMYQGQGEYRVLRIDNAPPVVDRIDTLLGPCAGPASSGTAEAYPDIGPEPAEAPLEQRIERAMQKWRSRGYISIDRALNGQVAQGNTAQHRLDLGAGDCYAIVALGDNGIIDLDLAVFAMNHGRAMRDGERDRDAVVRFCAEETHHMIEVRAYRGGGPYRIVALRLIEDATLRREGLEGPSRLLGAEWSSRAASRGLRARAERWLSIAPNAPMQIPLHLRSGGCYAIGGVPGPEFERGDLDIVVTDTLGNLLTWDVGPDNTPMAFRCSTRDEDVRVNVRLAGATRSRVLVLVASDEGSSP